MPVRSQRVKARDGGRNQAVTSGFFLLVFGPNPYLIRFWAIPTLFFRVFGWSEGRVPEGFWCRMLRSRYSSAAFRRCWGAADSGAGQDGNGLVAVPLQPVPNLDEALGLTAAGEDHRECQDVQACTVGESISGAHLTGAFGFELYRSDSDSDFYAPVIAVGAE